MVKNIKEYMKKYNKKYKRVKTADIKEYMKKYKSTDAFRRRRKENLKYYICECGGRYDSEHKNSHIKSKKHQRYNNKVLLEIIDELENMDMFYCEYTEKILDDLDKVDEGSFFDTDDSLDELNAMHHDEFSLDEFSLDEEPLEFDISATPHEDFEVLSDFDDIEDLDDIF